ncbi:MAG: hypothetical protein ACD_28C00032G0006 [uncultured bacterium]|nr:MAG: hypothetical protein ACD_28C00032G0006 [uncultured bacterium]KKT74908.1 MAG: Orotidine 5'-phosphate decarboxylase [Candidatus Peregrinibacteria bacterium GW2011_GWA2_44_7]
MEIDISISALSNSQAPQAHFADRLIASIRQKGNPVCVGLDPRLEQIPEFIKERQIKNYGRTVEAAANSLLEFNQGIIDAVADVVPCVKPQSAFYEQYGFIGSWVFEQTCKYAQDKGLIVIADVKRNDIGSTAEAYAKAYLDDVTVFDETFPGMSVDALTVTPYLGYDGVKPFIELAKKKAKGLFILLKTSNPSSGDLQDQLLDERVAEGFGTEGRLTNYELMAHLMESWGADEVGESGYSFVGAVVGATYPKQATRLRQILPETFFLVPGYGAQGGRAEDVKPCFNDDGLGAIVSSSRDIIFAYQENPEFPPTAYAEAARAAALAMAQELRT